MALALGMVPIFFIHGLYKNRGQGFFVDIVASLFTPSHKWQPSDPKIAAEYALFKSGNLGDMWIAGGVDNLAAVTVDK